MECHLFAILVLLILNTHTPVSGFFLTKDSFQKLRGIQDNSQGYREIQIKVIKCLFIPCNSNPLANKKEIYKRNDLNNDTNIDIFNNVTKRISNKLYSASKNRILQRNLTEANMEPIKDLQYLRNGGPFFLTPLFYNRKRAGWNTPWKGRRFQTELELNLNPFTQFYMGKQTGKKGSREKGKRKRAGITNFFTQTL